MTPASNNSLSREKMHQLLVAVGSQSKSANDESQVEVSEYNWHQPHCFDSEQMKKLDNFTKKSCITIAEKFTDMCQTDFAVKITSITQHFAYELFETYSGQDQNDYFLPFSLPKKRPFALIGIPVQAAKLWTNQLLGSDGDSQEDSGQELSKLEESFLLDVASVVVQILSESHPNYDFKSADELVRGHIPFEVKDTEEFCKITFNTQETGSENNAEAYILIPCSVLDTILGKAVYYDNIFSGEDISGAILENLKQMSIFVTARLGSLMLTFEEIMTLQAGDILLLEKSVNDTIDVVVDEKAVLRGRPAKSSGKYAVVITELAQVVQGTGTSIDTI